MPALLLFLALLSWLTLSAVSKAAVGAIFVVMCLARLPLRRRGAAYVDFTTGLLSGLFVPLIPALGSGALLALFLGLCVLVPDRQTFASYRWAWPFLALFAFWTVSQIVAGFDAEAFYIMYRGGDGPGEGGINGIVKMLQYSPPHAYTSLLSFSRYLLLFALFSAFSASVHLRDGFGRGLVFAAWPVMIIALAQYLKFDAGGQFFVNYTPYWQALGRVPATFSDPNAFGVAAVIIAAIYADVLRSEKKRLPRQFVFATLVFWCIAALFAGSRSYFLGLAVLAGLLALRGGRRATFTLLALLLTIIVALNILPGLIPALPVALQRTAKSVHLLSLGDAWFSRVSFWQLSVFVWLDNLMLGSGPGVFRSLVTPYSQAQGINIGTWVDNPNSFYLGVLAELGVMGMLALFISLRSLKWQSPALWPRFAVICLGVLLIFGPHLDFDEVAVLAAFVMSCAFTVVPQRILPFNFIFSACSLIIWLTIMFKSWFAANGLDLWEQDAGGFFRWSARSAKDLIYCDSNGIAKIRVQATTPGIEKDPVVITFYTVVDGHRQVTVGDTRAREVELHCLSYGIKNVAGLSAEPLRYRMEVSQVWTPRKYGMGLDSRLLGVKVYEDPPSKVR